MNQVKKFVFVVGILGFFCSFLIPYKASADCLSSVRAEYAARGLSGSGLEAEAIDNCLAEQRRLDQQARDQMASDMESAQVFYQIKLDYFYKLDAIEKDIDAKAGSNSSYVQCRFNSGNCAMSMRIPSDPTILDPNVFLDLIEYKEKCNNDLLQCWSKINTPIAPVYNQTIQPTKTNDQICSEEFGPSWIWNGTKNNSGGLNCGCKSGYVQKNGQCVTYDQDCNTEFSNTFFQKIGENGTRICDCKSGYMWTDQRTACVVAPVKTNDQICQDSYGLNSNWDGTKTSDGRLNCGCQVGYEWNTTRTACIYVPPKTNNQICQEDFLNSIWNGKLNTGNKPECDCVAGYEWNSAKTACIKKQIPATILFPVVIEDEPVTDIQEEMQEESIEEGEGEKEGELLAEDEGAKNDEIGQRKEKNEREGLIANIFGSFRGLFRRIFGWF